MREFNMSDRAALISEIEQNLWETWSNYGRGPECTLHDEEEVLWFETPIPIIPYNGVLRFRVKDRIDEKINRIVERFHDRGVQFTWLLHPSSFPPDLSDRLQRRALKYIEPIHGMARTLANLPDVPFPPAGFEIRKVTEEKDATAFLQFAAWRWHIPEEYVKLYGAIAAVFQFGKPGSRAHMWQAWHEGHPVAKAGMYLGSGSAGIHGVVTRPEACRRGLARILTLTALHEARSAGYHLAVLHSTPMAENLYQSLGFATTAEFYLFGSQEVRV
jgi:GNAT superfamily N-acetyltransferase